MIIQANELDRERLNRYLSKEPELNLFLIGDIEQNGFNTNFQTIWYEVEQDRIDWVILRWRNSLCLQSYQGRIDEKYVLFLSEKYNVVTLQGKASLLDRYKWKEYPKEKKCSFASLHHNISLDVHETLYLDEKYSDAIAELENKCFHTDKNSPENIRHEIENGTTKYFGILKENKLIGTAASTSESSKAGMIVGVCVDPSFRHIGYGSQLIAAVSNDLLSRDKIPCLFYSDPGAARLYKKAGYQDIGNWSIREK